MAISSQGTTLTFGGVAYTVTSISVEYGGGGDNNNQRQRVSAAHLDSDPNLAEPFFEIWQPDQQGDGRLSQSTGGTAGTAVQSTVQVEFIGATIPAWKATGTLSIAGPVNLTFQAATCSSSSIRLAVGDFVRGAASFTVS